MNKIPMHSVCVGRMLVDLPKGAPLEWQQQFDYADVSKLPLTVDTKAKFDALVEKRKDELGKPTKAHPKGALDIYKPVGDNAVILQFQDPELPSDPELTPDIYYTERYLWLGHWGYKYRTGELFKKQAMDLLPRIEKTFGQIQPINNLDPSDEPGFCIDSAMVVGKIGPIWSSPSADVPGWKDVSVDAGAREDDGSRAPLSWQQGKQSAQLPDPFHILQLKEDWAGESKKSDAEDRVESFEVLRKEEKRIAGMTGQETALRIKLANGQEYYRFDWSSVDDKSRTNKSGFSLDLEAGDYQYTPRYAPPPSEEDLLALWDAMLASLKPRPGAG